MSLESLFTDRKARKYIKESIESATDCGQGVCDCCGNRGFLLEAFDRHLCEKCCSRIVEEANNYDFVFKSSEVSGEDIVSILNEGYMVPDFEKLQNDANAKFNGSIKDLMKSYGLFIETYWNDKFLDGMLYISSKDIRSGNSKVNKFLIDYDSYYASKRGFSTIKPDADGTEVPKVVAPQARINKNKQLAANDTINAPKKRGSSVSTPVSQPNTAQASTPKAPKTKKPVIKTVPKGKGKLDISGNPNQIDIGCANGKVNIKCEFKSENGNTKTYFVSVGGNGVDMVIDSKGKGIDFIADKIIDNIIGDPAQVLPGFDGIHKDTFSINAYDIYKFVLDKQSFIDDFSVAIFFDGKVRPNNRIKLSSKAVVSRASLMGEITKYMDESIKKKYPVLFDKHNIVTTSIGKAVFTFKGFDKDGDPVVEAELGNKPITGRFGKDDSAWTDLANAEENLRILIDTAIRCSNSVIPNYQNSPYFNQKSQPGKDEFNIEVNSGKTDEYNIYAIYDSNEFIKTGNITFLMSVIDTGRTGIEQPKEYAKVIYRKAGIPLETFIKTEGEKIYKNYFATSNMTDVLTGSAREKMKNPSKKQVLFSKIADKFVKNHKEIGELKDLEVESYIDVNNDGRVIYATITITDPFYEYADDSKKLNDTIALDDKIDYLRLKELDTRMDDGPSVTYEVSDIQKFAEDISLAVLEGMIFEAFNIVRVNESGRKVFYF